MLTESERYQLHVLERGAIALLILAALVAVILIWRHRRRIASAADEAAVSALAAGVKAKRKISGKADAYRQRIIDRAGRS